MHYDMVAVFRFIVRHVILRRLIILSVLMEVRIELRAYQSCVFTPSFHEQIQSLVLRTGLRMGGNRDSSSMEGDIRTPE